MDTLKIAKEKVKMIAHRGLSGLEKENTIAAFIAAGNRTYYGMECDIHLTKDNVFVVCHDDHPGRISPTKKIIRNEEAIMEGKEEIRLNPAMTTDLINRVNSFLISPHPFFYNSVR